MAKDKLQFVTAYGPKERVSLDFTGPGRTKQSFKDECDINRIMARFAVTGMLDFVSRHEPRYMDCSGIDYRACMDVVVEANSMFADLPSEVRDRFMNDPARFLDFCSDKENLPELRKMGLAKPAPVEVSSLGSAPIVAPAAAGAA
ncbi:MAG: internal scaffolding protein [Microviridae sp.]|nr:MAG: internal scaffolding protein [Microviridae sp.]